MCKAPSLPCVDCGTTTNTFIGVEAVCESCGEKRNAVRALAERNFPIPVDRDADGVENDKRFTFGLTIDVAEVLEKHGYPKLGPSDFVQLQQALFRFIYRNEEV